MPIIYDSGPPIYNSGTANTDKTHHNGAKPTRRSPRNHKTKVFKRAQDCHDVPIHRGDSVELCNPNDDWYGQKGIVHNIPSKSVYILITVDNNIYTPIVRSIGDPIDIYIRRAGKNLCIIEDINKTT